MAAANDEEKLRLQREEERGIAIQRWSQLAWKIFDYVEPPYTSNLVLGDVCVMIDRAFRAFVEKHPNQ